MLIPDFNHVGDILAPCRPLFYHGSCILSMNPAAQPAVLGSLPLDIEPKYTELTTQLLEIPKISRNKQDLRI